MELSPDSILKNYKNGKVNKESSIEQLIDLIENSNSLSIRASCVNALGKIGIVDEKIFNLLENLLISDSDEGVRTEAARIIHRDYFKNAFKLVSWALLHEFSLDLLKQLHETILKIINYLVMSNSRSIIEEGITSIRTSEIKNGFEKLFLLTTLKDLTNDTLASYLTNFFTLLYLKKKFWRLRYKVAECLVVELDFQFKGLIKVPEEIKYLKFLKKLSLRYNQIASIPNWIESLIFLEELDLYSNSLTFLPSCIGNLRSLKNFSLSINKLEKIPEEICSLSRLEILELGLNQLKALPRSVGELISLKKLNIFENYLTHVPFSIGNLHELEYLNLSCNNLSSLPESLGSLKLLKVLNCENNQLIALPESIKNLGSLEYLNISKNKLVSLQESLIFLASLKEFYFGRNNLVQIPRFIEKLGEKGVQVYPKHH